MRRPLLVVLPLVAAFVAGVATGQARLPRPGGSAAPPPAAPSGPRMWADVVLELTTDQIPRRTHVRAHVDHWEPGAETGRHTHPGPVVFVMLDGELEETLADGTRRVIKSGQAFWKPPHQEHNVRNVGARPARALAVHLDPAR